MGNYKPMALSTGKVSKEERQKRIESEKKLRGADDKLHAPEYLTPRATEYFEAIVKFLSETEVLGNADIFTVTSTSIALDKMEELEKMYQLETDIDDKFKIMKMQDTVQKQYYKGASELGLSPTARIKLNVINNKKDEEKEDPLLKLLKERNNRLNKEE